MAEALEYLSHGNCAIVVPQYAYVPSALALNKTTEGVELQTAVIEAIRSRIDEVNPSTARASFSSGEPLSASGRRCRRPAGVPRFDAVGLESGLYLGVPFRSTLWKAWLRASESMAAGGRLQNVSEAGELRPGSSRHIMINHHDDPINKFSYQMVVQRPWWFRTAGHPTPKVPQETLFRPVISFVIALVDLLNGMDSKPGEFRLLAHDYRIDLREALEKPTIFRPHWNSAISSNRRYAVANRTGPSGD